MGGCCAPASVSDRGEGPPSQRVSRHLFGVRAQEGQADPSPLQTSGLQAGSM